MHLPRRVKVAAVPQGRYQPGERPVSWDRRFAGVDSILTDSAESLLLASSGGQSTPAPGWELLLTREIKTQQAEPSFEWTLYGIPRTASVAANSEAS